MNQPLNTIKNTNTTYVPQKNLEINQPYPLKKKQTETPSAQKTKQQATSISYDLPSDPILVKPSNLRQKKRVSIEYLLLDVNNHCYDLHKNNTILDRDDIRHSVSTIDKLHQNFLEELKKQGIEQDSNDTWKGLQYAAQYITACATLALGVFLLSQGEAEYGAKLMIFSAGLGLFTQGMGDTGGFEKMAAYVSQTETTKKNIASKLETSFVLLSLGIGLYQVVGVLPNGMEILTRIPENRALEFIKNAFTTSTLATSFLTNSMQHYHTSKIHTHNSEAKKYEAKKVYMENTMGRTITQVEANSKNQEAYVEVLKRMLNNIPVITNR